MTKKDKLYDILKDHQEHDMRELNDFVGFRYGARISELRREGHHIDTIQVGKGKFIYQLKKPAEYVQQSFI